jgi:hypothetical protein
VSKTFYDYDTDELCEIECYGAYDNGRSMDLSIDGQQPWANVPTSQIHKQKIDGFAQPQRYIITMPKWLAEDRGLPYDD